jgi:hypothetical protein
MIDANEQSSLTGKNSAQHQKQGQKKPKAISEIIANPTHVNRIGDNIERTVEERQERGSA